MTLHEKFLRTEMILAEVNSNTVASFLLDHQSAPKS